MSEVHNTEDLSSTTPKSHKFSTTKAYTVFFVQLIAMVFMFSSYNITANLASTLQGANATTALAVLYALYIISSFSFPLVIQLVRSQGPVLLFFGSLGYIGLPALSLVPEIYTLIIGSVLVGVCGFFWSSSYLTTSSLAIYIAERATLAEIQKGQHFSDVKEAPEDHMVHHVSDVTNQSHVDWYLSTIVDKNNRIIVNNLTPSQQTVLKEHSARTIGLFSSLSWLAMQAASILGALIAFGAFHIRLGDDLPNVYTAHTGSVKVFYGLMTAMSVIGSILYFIAWRIAPKRAFFKSNTKSKWVLYKENNGLQKLNQHLVTDDDAPDHELVEDENNVDDSGQDTNSNAVIVTLNNQSHHLPGRAQNDNRDDNNQLAVVKPMEILLRCIRTSARSAIDPAISFLLIPFFTVYIPLSFCISTFSSKGGVKKVLGVKYVPIFVLIVAVADVATAFIAKSYISSARRARFASILGLSIQAVALVIMYCFPYYDHWHDKGDAWMFACIIGILTGIGDALSISGISTLVATICRLNREVLSAVSSLLMCGRGIGLMLNFLLTSNTEFRQINWPIVASLVGASIICHIASWVRDLTPNVEKIMGIEEEPPVAAPTIDVVQVDDENNDSGDPVHDQHLEIDEKTEKEANYGKQDEVEMVNLEVSKTSASAESIASNEHSSSNSPLEDGENNSKPIVA